MRGSVVAVFVVAFIAQNGCLGGKAFAGVLAPVNQQRFKVLVASNAAKGALDAANATILASITASKTSVNQLLASAQAAVDQAQQAATLAGQNVVSCVSGFNYSVALVDSTSLDACDQTAPLGLLKFKIGGISVFNAHLGLIYGMCSGSYWSTFAAPTAPAVGTSPSTCFDDQVAVVDKQLTDLQQQIDADISAISEDAQNCIDDSVAGYSRQIAASSSQFTKCIGA